MRKDPIHIGITICPIVPRFSDDYLETFNSILSEKVSTKELKMTTEETVTISKKEYDDLVTDSLWLGDLENAGVDNWEGYEYAWEARSLRESEDNE